MAQNERKGLVPTGGHEAGQNGHRERCRALIAEWAASGQTQAEFCRRRKIHPMTFSGWKHRLGGKSTAWLAGGPRGRTGTPAFVPVRIRPTSEPVVERSQVVFTPPETRGSRPVGTDVGNGAPIEVQLRNGRVLRVPKGADPAHVARLANALDGEAAGSC
jgi:hypothetical protein